MTDTSTESTTTGGHQPELKRVLGPRLLLLFIVGDILGTGIYAITGSVAAMPGSIWVIGPISSHLASIIRTPGQGARWQGGCASHYARQLRAWPRDRPA